jgi:tetratricopeptide (TPR) repeat protein
MPEDLMPGQPLETGNSRKDAYDVLQTVSPELAHATITMRADQAPFAAIYQAEISALDFQDLLLDIYEAPFKNVDTSYVDAAEGARGLVESEYLFNYVPNFGMAHVISGPSQTSFVHYSVEIEPQHMTMARDPDAGIYYTRFELRGEVTTLDDAETIFQFTKEPFIQLTETQLRDVQARPFSYRDMFPLAVGDFNFRIVLKNQARNEYTIFETELHVPARSDAPYLGAPILLYGTAEMSGAEMTSAYRTYQFGSLRIEPNVKRAYAIGEALRAFIPIENASAEHQLRFRFVSREDPSEVIIEKQSAFEAYGGKPIVESMALVDLIGGHYRLIVDLLSPSDEILETTAADVDVTPRTEILRPWVARESINGEEVGLVKTALADQYLQLGDVSKARAMCQEALEHNPNLTTPRVVLARYHLDEKRPVEAIKLLEPAFAQNRENPQILLTLGDAHFEVKNYQRAAELFEAAIILRPPTTSLYNALAVSYAQQGNSEKAIQYLERSLELDPNQEQVKTLIEQIRNPKQQN